MGRWRVSARRYSDKHTVAIDHSATCVLKNNLQIGLLKKNKGQIKEFVDTWRIRVEDEGEKDVKAKADEGEVEVKSM